MIGSKVPRRGTRRASEGSRFRREQKASAAVVEIIARVVERRVKNRLFAGDRDQFAVASTLAAKAGGPKQSGGT